MTFWLVVAALAGFWLLASLAHSRSGGFRRGMAGGFAITTSMSATAVRRSAYITRPSTVTTRRTPAHHVGIHLADTRWLGCTWRGVYGALRDVILVVAPAQTGKTALLGRVVQDAPGAVFATSTKPDLCDLSRASRARRPIRMLNPYGIGGLTAGAMLAADHAAAGKVGDIRDVRWNPAHGCRVAHHAMLVAALFVSGGATGKMKDAAFWESNAVRALRCLLAAADLDGGGMRAVHRWSGLRDSRPVAILKASPDAPEGWAADLQELQGGAVETLKSIAVSLSTSLQFMALPELVALTNPGPGEQFDTAEFLRAGATLYVLGEHEPHSPIGPLFAAFTGVLFHEAKRLAATSRGGRLDPPLTMVLDEVTNTFRVPLDAWTSDTGGRGIPMVIAVQSRSQLRDAWGDNGAKTIWSNSAIKVTFGGDMDVDTLKELSELCGDRAAERGAHHRRIILSPRDILQLPDRQVLILRRNTPPVIGRSIAVWDRRNPPVAEPLVPAVEEPQDAANVVRLADHPRKAA